MFGLHIAWGFIGYLVYVYTPELYLDQYDDIIDEPGFRAITAALTVYFGVILSRWGGPCLTLECSLSSRTEMRAW